jgi:hypothetical protein
MPSERVLFRDIVPYETPIPWTRSADLPLGTWKSRSPCTGPTPRLRPRRPRPATRCIPRHRPRWHPSRPGGTTRTLARTGAANALPQAMGRTLPRPRGVTIEAVPRARSHSATTEARHHRAARRDRRVRIHARRAGAIRAQGLTDPPTQDVDLFVGPTVTADDFSDALRRAEDAPRAAHYDVTRVQAAECGITADALENMKRRIMNWAIRLRDSS